MSAPPRSFRPGPGHDLPPLVGGEAPERARAGVVMLHGRGASAESILALAGPLAAPGVTYLAPSAVAPGGHPAWYPRRFMEPIESNEPWLSAALETVGAALARLEAAGVPAERSVLLGFSQGACLALEYAARNGRRYGGVVGLSGGLIGPPGTRWEYPAGLAGTPVFLGCSDADFHIPRERVDASAAALRRLGAEVEERIYPGMGHTVNQDEVDWVRTLLLALAL